MSTFIKDLDKLARTYFLAKRYVIQKGYSGEIDWQEDVNFYNLTYQKFMREYTWVVLASGISDKVVSKVFPKIIEILRNWNDLDFISRNYSTLKIDLLQVFNNKLKISAILDTTLFINSYGYEYFKNEISIKGLSFLQTLPFIGEITCFHLAKNIGLSYAKPDRHLDRISKSLNLKSPHVLCTLISDYVDEKIQVVDLVLWRYATIDKNYENKINKLRLN